MKRSVCGLLIIFLLVTGSLFSQGAVYDITPSFLPNTVIEQVTANGNGMERYVYVLVNTGGKYTIGVYTKYESWSRMLLPNEDKKILGIASWFSGLYALEKNESGNNKLFNHYDKWSEVSSKKLEGNITRIKSSGEKRLLVFGNFSKNSNPYYVAEYYDNKWEPFSLENSPPEIAMLFAESEIAIVADRSSPGATLVLKHKTNGSFQTVSYDNNTGAWLRIGQPLPGPASQLIVVQEHYVLGTTDAGNPYLLTIKDDKWIPVDYSNAPFSKPQSLSFDFYNRPIVSGPHKKGDGFVVSTLPGTWASAGSLSSLPVEMVWAHSPRVYAVTADRKSIYAITIKGADKDKIQLNFGPLLTVNEEGSFRKKRSTATPKNIKEMIDVFQDDPDQTATFSYLAFRRFLLATNVEEKKRQISEARREASIAIGMVDQYVAQLVRLGTVPPADTSLRNTFADFLQSYRKLFAEISNYMQYLQTPTMEGPDMKKIDAYQNNAIEFAKMLRSNFKSLEATYNLYDEALGNMNDGFKSLKEATQKVLDAHKQ